MYRRMIFIPPPVLPGASPDEHQQKQDKLRADCPFLIIGRNKTGGCQYGDHLEQGLAENKFNIGSTGNPSA